MSTTAASPRAGLLPAAGDFEIERQRHLRAALERLRALRDERLRALVRAAKTRSPWHARRLRAVDAIERLPATGKGKRFVPLASGRADG